MTDDLSTRLTYKEALFIDNALKLAYAAELARLRMESAQRGDALVIESGMFTKLKYAKEIMDRKRERAEDMGG